jgi:PAS domain S-box-containing protein
MKEESETGDQMIEELKALRQRVEELEKCEEDHKRAKSALKASEKKFQQFYDEAPVGYHELDTKGRIIRVNRKELQMLGYNAGEMLGKPVWNFFEEEDTTRKVILAKLSGDVSFHNTFERTYRRKDGSTLPVLVEDRVVRRPCARARSSSASGRGWKRSEGWPGGSPMTSTTCS